MTERRRPWHSLRLQAAVIFVLLALLPALLVGVLLVEVNRDAVEMSERQLQAAVLSEVAASVERQLHRVEEELTRVANALVLEIQRGGAGDESFIGVRAALAASTAVRAARFEVPQAAIDTELRVAGDHTSLPRTDALVRDATRERGRAFARRADGLMLFVVVVSLGPGSPEGYLSSPIDSGALQGELAAKARSRFGGGNVRLLVVDGERRPVASSGIDERAGIDSAHGDIWKLLPAPSAWSTHLAVVGTHREQGIDMAGAVETIPSLGWAVALWRPQAEGYVSLTRMKQRAAIGTALSVGLALILGVFSAGQLTAPLLRMAEQARRIGARAWTLLEPLPKLRNELGELSASLDTMAADLRHSELEIAHEAELRTELSRYMNHQLVERIVRGEHSLTLGGERAVVSILFADVVGFTPLTESRPPEQVVGLLNELFSLMTEIVMRNGGIVDKFLGDSIMAIFGAPEPSPLHAREALRSAEEMLRFVASSNEDWRQRYGVRIRLAIGVSSGECTLGNVGSNKRMEYTAIGEVVNLAARLEALAGPGQVLLTENTRTAAGDGFDYVELGEQTITGRQAKVLVFALGGTA